MMNFPSLDPAFTQKINVPPPQAPTGMFAQGGVGRNILGSIGDFLLQRSGGQPIYAPTMMEQRRHQQSLDDYNRQRADKQTDWRDQYNYELQNPKPVNNDTADDYAFWQQHLPPEQFQQYIANKVNPPQYMDVPGVGLVQVPRAGAAPAAPTAPVGNLRDYGGPTPQASGGFPQ